MQQRSGPCHLTGRQEHANLHVVHVQVVLQDLGSRPAAFRKERYQEVINRFSSQELESLKNRNSRCPSARKCSGATPLPPEILAYAMDHDVDLIVVGTHGRKGLSHMLLGSVAAEITRASRTSVLVVGRALVNKLKNHPV
ncbi:MAG: universal stress protein [Myxococcota bacterium]